MVRSTLLVVDDGPSVLECVSKIFEREGLNVLRASGGREALEVLRREEPDGPEPTPEMSGEARMSFRDRRDP